MWQKQKAETSHRTIDNERRIDNKKGGKKQ